MSIYVVTFEAARPKTCAALKAAYPNHYEVHETALAIWARTGTAKDILLNLPMPEDERTGVVIFQITADYWGYSKKAFWDWLADTIRMDVNG
jgi:hypothetical protein